MRKFLFRKTIIKSNKTIGDAIQSLNLSTLKIVIIVNSKNIFLGTVTDGDIRRGLLKKLTLNSNILNVTNLRAKTISKKKINKYILEYMFKNKINRLPVLNKKKVPIDLICIEDFLERKQIKNKFLIMAGGKGLRMGSLTKNTPKPLLKLKKKPIIKHIIDKAIKDGFDDFYISVNYLHNKIIKKIGDGKKNNVNIKYLIEKKPLGTAGALNLLTNIKKNSKEPLVVTNGDVISKLNFKSLIDFHKENKADMTIVGGVQKFENPFGVIHFKGISIQSIVEKPITKNYVNAGIYTISENILKFLPNKKRIDMTDFIKILTKNKKKILVYPFHEYWMDIGNQKKLKEANNSKYIE
jgi:dTDP-glucose pyrophosphorylase